MSNLSRDTRVAALGAAAGLFSISVFLLVARIDNYYSYLEEINNDWYERGVENLTWIPFAFWHILLTFVASCISHRYVASLRRSPFLMWQLIGGVTLLSWAVTICIAIGLQLLMLGHTNSLEYMLSSIEPTFVAKYASVVFASHALYGSAIQAASREYLVQPLHNPTEDEIGTMTRRSFLRSSKGVIAVRGRKQTENSDVRDIMKPLGLS